MRLKTVRLVVMVALVILTAPLDVHMLGPSAGKVYRIGFLRQGHPHKTYVEAFQHGFRERGYVEGQNVVVEYRFDGSLEQLPHLAADLVRLQVDVLLVPNMPAALAAKHATSTIPIVMVGIRAGAGGQPTHRKSLCLGVQLHLLEARGLDAFDSAFAVMTSAHAGALLVLGDAMLFQHRRRLTELAVTSHLPTMSNVREFVEAGGLLSYGSSLPDTWRRAAYYVDRILKGAKPADLPVEQPTKFELVINLKTAKELGITIPPSLLLLADEVIR